MNKIFKIIILNFKMKNKILIIYFMKNLAFKAIK